MLANEPTQAGRRTSRGAIRHSRRALLPRAGLAAAGVLALCSQPGVAEAPARQQSGRQRLSSVCGVDDWGVQALWSCGHGRPPVPPLQAQPGAGWVGYAHPQFAAIYFAYPADWFRYESSQPYWIEPPAVVLVSPEGDAAFASVALDGVGETALAVAARGLRWVSPGGGELPIVCADATRDWQGNQAAVAVGGDGASFAIAGAYVIQGAPTLNACYAWADRFTERTQEVFLPIVYQFFGRGPIEEWKGVDDGEGGNGGDEGDDDDD